MTSQAKPIDLFALGQANFDAFIKEFASYGIEADPGIELRRGQGMLCYYSLEDRHIYLAVPDLASPTGKLQSLFFRSLLGCESNEELMQFFELFIPHIIAHELAHHYRQRYGTFGESLWNEEQVANRLAIAVRKHRLSPQKKKEARKFLRGAIVALSRQIEEKNIAIDSYHSVLHTLNVSGKLNVADFENVELLQTSLGVSSEKFLQGSGQLSPDLEERLEERDDLIDDIDEQYANDQLKYIYYHLGWLYLDLTSRETEYVDEFAHDYLNIKADLLSMIDPQEQVTVTAVQACFKAYQDTLAHSAVAGRYFYKRYRTLLLNKLQNAKLDVDAQTDHLRREASLVLEEWSEDKSDTLDYLSQLAPAELRNLFPHLVTDHLDPALQLPADLPAETDRRMWLHVTQAVPDSTAANTLYRLQVLDQTDVYRSLPAELLLELSHRFSLVKYSPGETVLWQHERNDDVFFLIIGRLEVLKTQDQVTERIGVINPGEMFGEIAFFTEDPRQATVRALEASECFVLTDADLQLWAYRHPTILMRMAGVLAKRLTNMYQTNRNETV